MTAIVIAASIALFLAYLVCLAILAYGFTHASAATARRAPLPPEGAASSTDTSATRKGRAA